MMQMTQLHVIFITLIFVDENYTKDMNSDFGFKYLSNLMYTEFLFVLHNRLFKILEGTNLSSQIQPH